MNAELDSLVPAGPGLGFDPLQDESAEGNAPADEYVHIRIQQRNGKKSLTTVQV